MSHFRTSPRGSDFKNDAFVTCFGLRTKSLLEKLRFPPHDSLASWVKVLVLYLFTSVEHRAFLSHLTLTSAIRAGS